MPVKIKPKDQCRSDLVSLGEVMLRLDPGDGRIAPPLESVTSALQLHRKSANPS